MEQLVVTPDELWPDYLHYWRRMGSRDISDYIERTSEVNRLVMIVWGVLEPHGPWLPVASDSMLSSIMADELAYRLNKLDGFQPIIFDAFMDVGFPSATQGFPGAIFYRSDAVPIIPQIWIQTLQQLVNQGFRKFFLVNGDGGNWHSFWAALCWNPTVVELIRSGVVLHGSNWDQAGRSYPHAAAPGHAMKKWMCDLAPRRIRLSALRHGLRPAPEAELMKLGTVPPIRPASEPGRWADWSMYPGQQELRCINGFNPEEYRSLLYDAEGNPLAVGVTAKDYEVNAADLHRLVRWVMSQPTRR